MSKIKWEWDFSGLVHTKWAGKKIYHYKSISSTNIKAKELAAQGAPGGSVVLADKQTAGRGRRGRQWDSPAGENLYFTLLLYPAISPSKASMLTLVMALAVVETLEATTGVETWIKWPNDIILDGKKVAGILTEMQARDNRIDYVIIGVGINVRSREFEGELAEKATSLETETKRRVAREALLAGILEHFEKLCERFYEKGDLRDLRQSYESYLINRGRRVRVLDPAGEFTGTALGINDEGELLVETDENIVRTVYAGEVSVRGILGYV